MNTPRLAAPVLARDAPRALLPPTIIGLALMLGAGMTHVALSDVMTPTASEAFLWIVATPGLLLLAYAAFLVWFFRDPNRVIGAGVVSPADGKVLFVEPHHDADVGPGLRVAIFMSPLDVHVNRAATTARLVSLQHIDGGYLPAFNKESERNERVITIWEHAADDGTMPLGAQYKLVQIAGAVARRIVPWVEAGVTLDKGARYGMIKLGSRVDVYLPEGVVPVVKAGNRVIAGQTTLA